MMTTKVERLLAFLDEMFPLASCELVYQKDHELVIAVMLSAQTTDKAVNATTRKLFSRFPSLDDLHRAPLLEIENCIKNLGLYKNKARYIKGIAEVLISRFNYQVPKDKDLLMVLPGVGNKTAGVIRAELFKIPDLPVDTHVSRVAKRLSLAKLEDDPLSVEIKLKKLLPKERWIKSHHQLIHFGRYFCKAKNPHCSECKIIETCSYKNKRLAKI
ncbi:MAG: endonuclease III [Erysipelotrichia bacterium]|nr:endonuclease III [Erysipelotrichia bacterium]